MRALPTGTVTLLFTDIEGSTRLLQQLGERYDNLLEACRSLQRAAFLEFHGHEVDTQGDAFFVAFARASDAVAAAVAAQRALASHPWPEGTTVRVRIGLHTGEPQCSSEDYVGLDVHRAARIMSAGHGGQVLLSQTTRDLVEHSLPGGVHLQDLGAQRLKDLQQPSHLFQLVITGLSADFPPLKTLDSCPNNLPLQPTPFIGREKEVDALQQLLLRESSRLVTLTGPGGVGKTRLGLQVAAELADQFADGTFFVALAPVSETEQVVPAIIQTLSISESGGQPLLVLLKSALKDKHLLLLLDNFEQVVEAAQIVAEVLATCPKLIVLVTSRVVLHVRAEREFAVPPLSLPNPNRLPDLGTLSQYEAVALFIERAQATKPDFAVTNANAPAVAAICARLDGLPLAIELAAARIKYFSPHALLSRLEQGLSILSGGARDLPVRQQTLRATIAWSYDLLTPEERKLFRRLSVFVRGFTWQAAEAVCTVVGGLQGDILEGLLSLFDNSLLRQQETNEGEARFWMLHVLREFGLECLATSGEMEIVRGAHANYYLRLAEEAFPEFLGPQQTRWLERLEWEHQNLRVALRWWLEQEEGALALRLARALGWFWLFHLHYSEGRTFLERTLALAPAEKTTVRADALWLLGWQIFNLGELARAEEVSREGLALAREIGDPLTVAHCLHILGIVALVQSNFDAAHSMYEECVALYRQTGEQDALAWALSNWARVTIRQGEYVWARTLAEEGLALFRKRGNLRESLYALLRLVEVSFLQGELAHACALAEECLGLCTEERSFHKPVALYHLGQIVLQQGDAARACSLAEESLALFKEAGDKNDCCLSLCLLGRVFTAQRDYAAARTYYEQSLLIAREQGFKWELASGLEGLASVVAEQKEVIWAGRLWGAAESLRNTIGSPQPPVFRAGYERSIAAARTYLGEKTFTAIWAEGRMMTPEQVLGALGRAEASIQTLAEQPSTSTAKPSPRYPDGLTAREVEVLHLVAKGLTDAQIAEQLVISTRTVNTHLTSIYGKIQVSSRSAATYYSIEHKLV